jgi:hypothetical protein
MVGQGALPTRKRPAANIDLAVKMPRHAADDRQRGLVSLKCFRHRRRSAQAVPIVRNVTVTGQFFQKIAISSGAITRDFIEEEVEVVNFAERAGRMPSVCVQPPFAKSTERWPGLSHRPATLPGHRFKFGKSAIEKPGDRVVVRLSHKPL